MGLLLRNLVKIVLGGSSGKGLIHSKTAYGVLLMALPMVFGWFGAEISDEDAQAVVEQLVIAGGAMLAIYGRVKASGPIRAI